MEKPHRKLVSFPELKPRYGICYSRRHLLNLEARKQFPRRVPIGANRVGWIEAEIDAWINSKVEARQ